MSAPQDTLGRPLHDLRISVIDRCNLRCTYCMPAEVFGKDYPFLHEKNWLDFNEIARLVSLFVGFGARKIRLTGGEPLLRPGIEELVRSLSGIDLISDLALTTNGMRLEGKAHALARAGLHRITVSLDAMDDAVFHAMSGERGKVATVLAGIASARNAGLDVKINCVIQRGVNESQVLPLARYFAPRNIPVRFIEYMDVGNRNGWNGGQVVPSAEVLRTLQTAFDLQPADPAYRGEVARRYQSPDGSWEIGLISSITQPFCRDCTRARLSAEGKLYTCLFAAHGHDFGTPLRQGASDEALAAMLTKIWSHRDDRYSELRDQLTVDDKPEMSYLGG